MLESMLSPELQEQIQGYFKECVKARSLVLRKGQRVMIAEVAKAFASSITLDIHSPQKPGSICVIEAGTGTGKTLAYTLGALPVAMEYDKPLVISTATVALQEQLFYKDLPELKTHSSLDFEFALVKGRARYICLSKLLLWEKHEGANQSLFMEDMLLGDSQTATGEDIKLYREMISAIDDNEWDGERDHWREEVNHKTWSAVMANRQDCSGKKCPHYGDCSFFDARKSIADADVIITNHDLVMADLFQEDANILPPIEDAFYIFDEGHHLPDKALSHFSSSFRIRASQTWLLRSQAMLEKLQDEEILKYLPQGDLVRTQEAIMNAQEKMDDLYDLVSQCFENNLEEKQNSSRNGNFRNNNSKSNFRNDDNLYCRFENGLVPEQLSELAKELKDSFLQLTRHSKDFLEVLKAHIEQDNSEEGMAYLSAIANLLERAEASTDLFAHFSNTKSSQELAKWIALHDFSDARDFQLSANPIHAGELLDELIWSRCLAVLITSATLTALGDFNYFIERSGLPEHAQYFKISSPFDYQNCAKLVLPDIQSEPNDSANFPLEVANYIEKWQPLSMGSLVLFSSWAQMNDVSDYVDSKFHKHILKQGDLSKEEILSQHKARIDANQHSMIFGLASFAEGIDLPGDYLTHVIICKIPFSVPTDPMAEALSEWVSQQGRNPFSAISVPEASLKLIQSCGRLLRSESDRGRVSILDKRLRTKSYGKQLIAALPPYQIQYGDE
jgi:ATP-dependent DNA helicase DinG